MGNEEKGHSLQPTDERVQSFFESELPAIEVAPGAALSDPA